MAKRYFRVRKQPSMGYAITGVITLALMMLVGNQVLASVGTTIGNISCTAIFQNNTCGAGAGVSTGSPFYAALSFAGLNETGGTWKTTGILGILGMMAAASFILTFIKVSLKGDA